MKTDRELLELAARACGLVIDKRRQAERDLICNPDTASLFLVDGSTAWNPLKEDGDALRLAVKLNFRIDILPWGSECASWNAKSGDAEPKGEDHFAATRRAITRAAAQMQLNKEQDNGK